MIYSKEQLHVIRNGGNEIIAIATKSGQHIEIYKTVKVGFDDIGELFEDMVDGEARDGKLKKDFNPKHCTDCDGTGKVNGGECVLCDGTGLKN